jgi:DNA segregation ATPase FtsK/SpoIIIE, S-DNA-T family
MAKKKRSNRFFGSFDYSRKMEITGILTMAISLLLLLSIASYHPDDYAIVKSLSYDSILAIDQGPALRVHNWLGVAGAYLSFLFVPTLFGYTSMLIPIIILSLGWYIFRLYDLNELIWPVAYGFWMLVLLSTTLGWFYIEYEAYSMAWSGNSGIYIAQILQNVTGIGSVIILFVLLIVSLMVLIDRDLQKTIDRSRNWFSGFNEKREQKKEQKRKMKAIKKRQEAEAAHKNEFGLNAKETRRPASIDDIVERSQEEDRLREEERKKESAELEKKPPRAVLEKGLSDDQENDDDVEISVYVGKGDEEADARELDRQNKEKAREIPVIKYKFPGIDLLDSPPNEGNEVDLEEIKINKKIILEKLRRHKIEILSINAIVGPTVTLYEIEPAPDVKISKIESYANDLKMATAAHGLRIIAPIPGRSAVGIEVPNKTRETVYIKQSSTPKNL